MRSSQRKIWTLLHHHLQGHPQCQSSMAMGKKSPWLWRAPCTKFTCGTCKQSRDVLTTRGDLDWQASSNGRKYLSASMKFAFGGAAAPSLEKKERWKGKMKKKKKSSLLSTLLYFPTLLVSTQLKVLQAPSWGGYELTTCNLRKKTPECHV